MQTGYLPAYFCNNFASAITKFKQLQEPVVFLQINPLWAIYSVKLTYRVASLVCDLPCETIHFWVQKLTVFLRPLHRLRQ